MVGLRRFTRLIYLAMRGRPGHVGNGKGIFRPFTSDWAKFLIGILAFYCQIQFHDLQPLTSRFTCDTLDLHNRPHGVFFIPLVLYVNRVYAIVRSR